MATDVFLIEELTKKENIEDDNKILIEDSEDTKQSTVRNLKKNFNGDTKEPSNFLFFSSKKANEIKESLQRELSSKASLVEYESLKKSIDDIITIQSESDTKDIELIIARDGENNLKDRLDRDVKSAGFKYLKKYKRSVSGNRIYFGNFSGYADVLVNTDVPGNLIVRSVNYFNIEDMRGSNEFYISYSDYGFTYKQKAIREDKFTDVYIPFNNVPAGTYYFSANIYNDDVVDNGQTIKFKLSTIDVELKFSDRSIQYLTLDLTNLNSNLMYFNFTTSKILTEISFSFPEDDFVENSELRFENVMLSTTELLNEFVPYKVEYYPINGKQYVNDIRIDRCELYFEGFGCEIIADYYDDKYTIEYIIDHLSSVEKNVNEDIDQCGLITNYGIYNFFASNTTNKNSSSFIEEVKKDKFVRNGHNSIKMTFMESGTNPSLSLELKEIPDDIEYITFLFYVDKYASYYMEEEAITLLLVSDNPNIYPPNNYYKKSIQKDSIIQGWNSIKLLMSEFETIGNPNKNDINRIIVSVSNNNNLLNRCIYMNSIIFNQTMKPVVLLGFNGIYDNSFEYTFPFLTSKDLDYTVFLNDSQTLSGSELDSIIMYKSSGLEIGHYGCNPNKELLLEDDNFREQYVALTNIKNYLKANMTYDPISYSAPYGNIRPITIDILRDIGYKIAKTGEDGYCNFFSKKDFCIPSIELNNESDLEYIKNKITYAINSGQTIAISTYDITEYGDEINAKKSVFEELIEFIANLVDTNQIECMSYKTFFEKCVK